jgi:hypothetical protein
MANRPALLWFEKMAGSDRREEANACMYEGSNTGMSDATETVAPWQRPPKQPQNFSSPARQQ